MATLREMLVKIYQPKQGLIEYGPGGSTQDGATDLAVLGGGPNQGDSEGAGGGGGIDFPEFRYAGVEGGAGGGGGAGGFDLSSIDWSDPGQVEMARRWMSREGGQAGEPGGAGAGGLEYGDPNAFVDPSLPSWASKFLPFPLSVVAGIGAGGMRAHNAGLVSDYVEQFDDLEGLSGWQQAGAALGPTFGNSYGEGTPEALRDALTQAAGGAGESGLVSVNRGGITASYDPASGLIRGAYPQAGSAYDAGISPGGGAGERSSRSSSSYRDTSPGRRGARDMSRSTTGGDQGGRGGGGRGPGGGPGGQSSGSDPGGWRHEGGPIYGEPGEEVNITALAGEHVMSPEAVEMFGPETFEQINNLARMMRNQHYPSRG